MEAESNWLQEKRKNKSQGTMGRSGGEGGSRGGGGGGGEGRARQGRPRKAATPGGSGGGEQEGGEQEQEQEGREQGREEEQGREQEGRVLLEGMGSDSEASVASAELKFKKKKEGIPCFLPPDLLHQAMPILLMEGFSGNQATVAVATFICLARRIISHGPLQPGPRLSLDQFVLSRNTSTYQKRRQSEEIAGDTLTEYSRVVSEGKHPVVIHWDEKMMREEMEGRGDFRSRLITCLSSPASPNFQQLLAASPLDNPTGYHVAYEAYNQLKAIGLCENVIAAVSDTPSVNFGQENGAMYQIQVMLEKQIIEIPCGHHQAELPAKAVQVCFSFKANIFDQIFYADK